MKKNSTDFFLKELKDKGLIVAYCGSCNAQTRDRKSANGGGGHSATGC